MLILRSLLFSIGMTLSTLVFAPLSLLTFPFPVKVRYAFITQWCRFNLWWLGITCNLRYTVEGRENIPAIPGIILSKHQSAWETLALSLIFPTQVWLLKRELLWVPFFGWGLAMLKPIAINRKEGKKAMQQLLEQGEQRLKDGLWVVIFPEGTRVAPGEKRRYAPGGALLSRHSGRLVVPVAHNAGEFWPRRGFIKRPGTIRLVIGSPIDPEGHSASEINAAAETWIENKVREISTHRSNPLK
ncbi:MAG: 1-acyl-sn-glycerol-3-phosphate acyltransferase [Gammaproteobacteria bacterium]|nr:1-acyl-sn-glycerol-3-phosphate acyltransferase [Gammaproteobacteria bacterium]